MTEWNIPFSLHLISTGVTGCRNTPVYIHAMLSPFVLYVAPLLIIVEVHSHASAQSQANNLLQYVTASTERVYSLQPTNIKPALCVFVCFPDYPGAVYPRIPVPAPPATRVWCRRVPSGSVRLEEKMHLFLPAAAPGHHDS